MSAHELPSFPEPSAGKYRTLVELGQGGSAIVHLAVASGPGGFNKLVVLKRLKPDQADDPDLRAMFLREARLSARLSHPNIVQTYGVNEDDGVPAIVMEYLDGQPLAKVLNRARAGEVSLGMYLQIVIDGLAGLHHAHELVDFDGSPVGVVHRDMSPHNLFVTFDGQAKVLDFGIAKLNRITEATQTGVIKGKIRYMPPEQISGDNVDRRADVYAVGVMLWEIAAGVRLWLGESDGVVMHRVLNGDVPSPRTVRPDCPERLEQICMKALAADPMQRHATAAELEAELSSFVSELGPPIGARDISKVMNNLFADTRARAKSVIEVQLSQVASLSASDSAEAHGNEGGDYPFGTTGSLTALASPPTAVDSGASKDRTRFAAAVAVLLLVGAVAALMLHKRSEPPTEPDAAARRPSPLATAQAVATTAPTSAPAVTVDERPATPSDAPSSGLQVARPAASAKGTPAARPAGHLGKAQGKPDCDPPYFIDDRLIRVYKRECM